MPTLFSLSSVLRPLIFRFGDNSFSHISSLPKFNITSKQASSKESATNGSQAQNTSDKPSIYNTFLTMLSRPFFKSEAPKATSEPSPIQRYTPRRPRSPPPPPDIVLNGWDPRTSTRLLEPALAQDIWRALPERWQFTHEWDLVFSLEQHGCSLTTLYDNCAAVKDTFGFYLVVVGDTLGGVFGAGLSDAPGPSNRYFGNRDSFLWKKSGDTPTKDGGTASSFKTFRVGGLNDYIAFCTFDSLSIGAGKDGTTGLWLNDRFDRGFSGKCDTFLNEPLTDVDAGTFDVLGVEVWRIPF